MVRVCPVCGKPVAEDLASPCFPFCSARCRGIDLGNWLTERYVIAEDVPESEGADAWAEDEE